MKYKGLENDFLCIREFAKYVGISVESLRHYDRKGIFKPAKYGEGDFSKYRYYSPHQITAVKMIRVLTEIGVPLVVIKELSEKRNPEKVLNCCVQAKTGWQTRYDSCKM